VFGVMMKSIWSPSRGTSTT